VTAEDLQALYKASAETEPEKLENLPIHALQSYRKYFFDVQQYVSDVRLETKCRDRIQAIEREIELRRIEEKAERRHQEAHGVGKKTLSW
jgi:hypothetical protein